MTTAYQNRFSATHLDGTPIFQNAQDQRAEAIVAQAIAMAWQCEVRPFGMLAPIDWYAMRDGRMIGLIETKTRSHPSGQYRTVFLNVRKWLALHLGAVGLGVPSIFVVQFTNEIRWIPMSEVDGTQHRIGGTRKVVKSHSDIEPVIEVPVAGMYQLT